MKSFTHLPRARRHVTTVGLVLAAAASLTLTACAGAATPSGSSSGSGGTGGGTIAVALITKTSTNPFFLAMKKGAEDEAAKDGVTSPTPPVRRTATRTARSRPSRPPWRAATRAS